jgi:hypothetical protein
MSEMTSALCTACLSLLQLLVPTSKVYSVLLFCFCFAGELLVLISGSALAHRGRQRAALHCAIVSGPAVLLQAMHAADSTP